jgi:uncharacterized repeat protein (TIGR04138 family)
MHELAQAVADICRRDPRFRFDAYIFVFEALNFAHHKLGMGRPRDETAELEAEESEEDELDDEDLDDEEDVAGDPHRGERHLSGQELCEAIRRYALEQYGYMAKCVLNSWGVYTTGDFGDVVFNLIDAEKMHKTPNDKREDFDDVFDFDVGLRQEFKITSPE